MANASDYLEQQIYNHIFRDDIFSKPTTIAIGLTADIPTDDGYVEIANSNNYARYEHASGNAFWDEMSTPGSGANTNEIEFNTATGDWGMVSGVIITDSATYGDGNLLMHGPLTDARLVQNGDTFKFSAGNLEISVQ
jgi:hypothetical protein